MENKKKYKKYAVMLNGNHYMDSFAVSAEKAINNVRFRMYKEEGAWFNVPPMDEFDAVEL